MNYFLVRYANTDNPIECITELELAKIEYCAEQFDGFTGLHIIKHLTKQEADEWEYNENSKKTKT